MIYLKDPPAEIQMIDENGFVNSVWLEWFANAKNRISPELHDVIEAITDGTLGTTVAADFRVDALAPLLLSSMGKRAQFVWKDADEIYLNAGAYYHNGTTDQIVYWDSRLTFQFQNLAASDWSYLYIDDSAVVTLGSNLLTTSELIDYTNEPTWSQAKHGWYNGEDKCIFAVRTDGSSNILQFWHDGGDFVLYDADFGDLTNGTSATYTDVTLTMPKFSTKAYITTDTYYVNNNTQVYIRPNGSSGSSPIFVGEVASGSTMNINNVMCITDTSQKIEYKHNASTSNTFSIFTNGWYFPDTV